MKIGSQNFIFTYKSARAPLSDTESTCHRWERMTDISAEDAVAAAVAPTNFGLLLSRGP